MTVLSAAATDAAEDDAQIAFAGRRGCMSFCIPCFPSETTASWCSLRSPANNKDRYWWWCRRWSAFIRRIRRSNHKKHCSFRYDPLSYALNFDHGIPAEEGGYGYKGFSARLAAVSLPEKADEDSREDHVPAVSNIQK